MWSLFDQIFMTNPNNYKYQFINFSNLLFYKVSSSFEIFYYKRLITLTVIILSEYKVKLSLHKPDQEIIKFRENLPFI